MKKVMVATMAVALAFSVQADLFVLYNSSFGVADADGFSPLLAGGEQAFIQLIWAGVDGLVDGDAGIGGALAGGDDVILFEGLGPVVSAGDFTTEYGVFDAFNVEALGINGGLVYGRIFQDSLASAGSFYYQGSLGAIPGVDLGAAPPPTPTAYDVAPASAFAVANLVVVPEPATIGLIGIAGLGMFLARKKTTRI